MCFDLIGKLCLISIWIQIDEEVISYFETLIQIKQPTSTRLGHFN